jgi:flagellar protein FliS
MTYPAAASAYRANAVMTASPEKLIKLLYEGAIRHLERCRSSLTHPATSHDAATGESLGKAFSIVSELRASLQPQPGSDVAQNLERLYDFILDQLSQANIRRTPEAVEQSLRIMRTLKEGWDGVIPG